MAPPKRRRRRNPAPDCWTLPVELLLEIVAVSDAATLVRCAAVCRSLRRDILSASFLRRVTQQGAGGIAPKVLAYLHTRPMRNRRRDLGRLVSLVHPATAAASRFAHGSLAPYLASRGAALSLLRRYNPVTSRGGLVLLRRRTDIKWRWSGASKHCSGDLCVYNLMDGSVHAYLSHPPDLDANWYSHTYVLLTPADGIAGCSSFLLLAAHFNPYDSKTDGCRITLQAAKPSSGATACTWGPPTSYGHRCRSYGFIEEDREAVVLHGGIVHWLLLGVRILAYDIHTKTMATVKLPPTCNSHSQQQRILGTSTDDGRLQLVTAQEFMVSIWVKSSSSEGGWTRKAVIDTENMLGSLLHHPSITAPDQMRIEFERSGESSGVVLLTAHYRDGMLLRRDLGPLIVLVLDLETKEMRKQDRHPSILFEVDLSARLRSMKIF